MMNLTDSFNRKIDYLRLSVTDRCNLRCTYCMPDTGITKLSHQNILSYEELYQIAHTATGLGVEKIRLTGGEPLVRKGVVNFLERLNKLPGLKELALTTNGLLLAKMAEELKSAGVKRLNISLDSLNPETFAKITRKDHFNQVRQGITAAEAAGFQIKLNMVVMRGINDHEVLDFASWSLQKPFSIRFIEYMPAINQQEGESLAFSGADIIKRIAAKYPLDPMIRNRRSGPAREFRIKGAKGSLGVITPMSEHFCGACNRIRVTSTGMLRGCLFSSQEFDLKPSLRGDSPTTLDEIFRQCVQNKAEKHQVSWQEKPKELVAMSRIGG